MLLSGHAPAQFEGTVRWVHIDGDHADHSVMNDLRGLPIPDRYRAAVPHDAVRGRQVLHCAVGRLRNLRALIRNISPVICTAAGSA
jgi:hypothetical protein